MRRLSVTAIAEIQPMQDEKRNRSFSLWDFFYAVDMAIACLITYLIITYALAPFVDKPDDLLGGMWAVVATVFVFRETRVSSLSAGVARLIATCVSFALCLLYLLIFPFTAVGLAALLGIGTAIMTLLGPAWRHRHNGNNHHRRHGRRRNELSGRLAAAATAFCRHRGRDLRRCFVQMDRFVSVLSV